MFRSEILLRYLYSFESSDKSNGVNFPSDFYLRAVSNSAKKQRVSFRKQNTRNKLKAKSVKLNFAQLFIMRTGYGQKLSTIIINRSLGPSAALRASLTSSFAPFGPSGCVTHAALHRDASRTDASYMHWLYTMRYFSATDERTNEQGNSRSRKLCV